VIQIFFRTAILASCLVAFLAGAANAQQKCREGKTSNGDCVNPGLAATMSQTGGALAQPKISQTASPILPADDRFYGYPHQLR
jgi:hypothetical protein